MRNSTWKRLKIKCRKESVFVERAFVIKSIWNALISRAAMHNPSLLRTSNGHERLNRTQPQKRFKRSRFFKFGPLPVSFFIFVFSWQFLMQLIVNNIADDWIRTVDLCYWKRSLYQLRHNNCPYSRFITL